MRSAVFILLFLGAWVTSSARAEMIVLAAPGTGDAYYAEVADQIFDFHVTFAKQIEGRDEVLILTDAGAYDRYAEALGEARVGMVSMLDIWMRDFGTINPANPVMFRYTAEGQGGGTGGQAVADDVQERLAVLAEDAGLFFLESDYLNDGGNFVDDGAGNAVVSRKFLRDNGLSEQEARRILRRLAKVREVAFIEADEQGGLEHADGVISFVDVNTLIINSYPDDPEYARRLKADLRRGLPGVTIHEITTPFDGARIYDEKFGSACGLYTNALVTPERIYLPEFGVPEDRIALAQVKAATSREVVPVPSWQVCFMGGGVRCMSWQLRGENASRLRAYFERVEHSGSGPHE